MATEPARGRRVSPPGDERGGGGLVDPGARGLPYVAEEATNLGPGLIEMLSDPRHFRVTPMHCVDYDDSPEPVAQRSRWAALAFWKRRPR